MKTLIKKGRKIVGFVYENNSEFWFAFSKPSQSEYISFKCNSIEDGEKKINQYIL